MQRENITLADAVKRVLHLPAVAEKTFLITIGDRTVTGMVARDQMVGPWQIPVADCAVTTASPTATTAKRCRSANVRRWRCWTSPPPAARRSGSADQPAATEIGSLKRVKLSAN